MGKDMRMFGTNGVRGIINEDLSCELSLRLGKSIGSVMGGTMAIANDPRTSSDIIKFAVMSGLMSVGVNIIDLGMVPTPALQHYVKSRSNLTGGVMITASHNPPEFNGIKCISSDGTECSHEEECKIESTYDGEIPCVKWSDVGTYLRVTDAATEYVQSIVSKVDVEAIRAAKIKVCVDCANGASTETTPMLMKALGVRAVTINGNPQGEFPGHPSEPTEENLSELKNMVVATGADMGIAHDGDADRCIFITPDGRYVSGDKALAIIGKEIVKANKGKVVVTVATSKIVEDCVTEAGGEVTYTEVGSPIVARAMMRTGGLFGGEENGGLIFADHQFCRDGAMAAAKMLEIIANGETLTTLMDRLPRYTTLKRAVPCPDKLKKPVLDELTSLHSGERVDCRDGLRIDYDDGWVLLRPSGTEPKFRIYSESRDEEIAEKRSMNLVEEFNSTLEKLNID